MKIIMILERYAGYQWYEKKMKIIVISKSRGIQGISGKYKMTTLFVM